MLKLFELSQPQKRIWVTQNLYPQSSMFNIGGAVTIHGEIDVPRLQQAIAAFILYYDAFHIRIKTVDGEPYQYFNDSDTQPVPFIDFRKFSMPTKAYQDWIEKKASDFFILEERPLYDFAVFCLDGFTYGYLIKLHHIVADGRSIQLLTDTIGDYYMKLCNGTTDLDLVKAPSYRDFLLKEKAYQESKRFHTDRQFWNDYFSELPEDRKALAEEIKGKRKVFYLEKERIEKVRSFCNQSGISLNAFFASVYILYEYKRYSREHVVIGNPTFGRTGIHKNTFGMFVSSMPFRYKINKNVSLSDTFHEIDLQIKNCFRHHQYPYNLLVKDLQLGSQPLYTTCVNYYSTYLPKTFSGYPVDNWEFYAGEQEYDMQLIIREWLDNNGMQIDVDYKTSIFTEEQIEDMIIRIKLIMDTAFNNPQIAVARIGILSQQEEDKLLTTVNQSYQMPPITETILDMFKAQVSKNSDKVAVKHHDMGLTFGEVDRQSDILAYKLKCSGIAKNEVVALYTEHSIGVFVGILGIMKAGSAFLPIDLNSPIERIQYMIEDSKVRFLITNLCIDNLSFSGMVVRLNELDYDQWHTQPGFNYDTEPDMLAYVLYTSGSTGQPKGTMISHKSLYNYIQWACKQYCTLEREVFPLYTSLSFDLTITSLFVPLVSGGMVVIYRDEYIDKVLEHVLHDNVCTIIKMTPSHLRLIVDMDLHSSSIQKLILGGENLSVELAHSAYAAFGKSVIIYNEYGPTEATVGCMIYQYDSQKELYGSVPIGKSIDRVRVYILDKDRNPLPVGWPGEIYIAGSGVAKGYLNKPDLTAQVFITDERYGEEPLYRTGDLARFIRDDCIEYIGRIDNQIKLNGFRIELSEIEWHLQSYPDILHCAVVRKTINCTSMLCAYYIAKVKLSEDMLKNYLSTKLPAYTIPAFIYQVDAFPTTVNGKLNADLLPVPDLPNTIIGATNKNEAVITQAISSLIKKPVSVNVNFYHVGGDSIKAIQLSSRLKMQGINLSVKDILSHPVVSEMARYVRTDAEESIDQGLCSGTINDTPMHHWFLKTQYEAPSKYCQSMMIMLNETWTSGILNDILVYLVQHHDALRLRMDKDTKQLFYGNEDTASVDSFIQFNRDTPLDDTGKAISLNMCKEQLVMSIDILTGPIISSGYIRQKNAPDIWMIVIHHFAVDGMSWRILLEDINFLMECHKSNKSFELPKKTYSYQAWAANMSTLMQQLPCRDKKINTVCSAIQQRLPDKHTNVNSGTLDRDRTSRFTNEAGVFYHMSTEELLIASLLIACNSCFGQTYASVEVERDGRLLPGIQIDVSRTVGWFTIINQIEFPIDNINLGNHLKTTKELMRKELGCIQTKGLFEERRGSGLKSIRFNYLGELTDSYQFFDIDPHGFVDDIKNSCLTSFLEVICFIQKGYFHYWVFSESESESLTRDIGERFSECWEISIDRILDYCLSKKGVEFTPSDFEMADFTQEELDSLFI